MTRYSVEDAKTKWCPMSAGRSGPHTCLAGECMAWKWVVTNIDTTSAPDPENLAAYYVASYDTHGFCGLTVATHR